jgi:hypothetical protein
MVQIHIFIFFITTLTPMCDLDLEILHATLRAHHSEQLCQVILKSLYACRSFALDKRFSMTSVTLTFGLETWFMCGTLFLVVQNLGPCGQGQGHILGSKF